tara:strand:- start:9144 stop:9542 length:399 start_codon:yes stop_codon:yes gene_type:complete
MEELDEVAQLLYGPGELMEGSAMSNDDAIAYARQRSHRAPYCVVRDWIWVELEMTEAQRSVLVQSGRQPALIYAHSVVFDSARRFDVGDFVRTSPLVAFEEGFLFRTGNSIYILLGEGLRKRAKSETVGRIA